LQISCGSASSRSAKIIVHELRKPACRIGGTFSARNIFSRQTIHRIG
jgi:hypothetical protein